MPSDTSVSGTEHGEVLEDLNRPDEDNVPRASVSAVVEYVETYDNGGGGGGGGPLGPPSATGTVGFSIAISVVCDCGREIDLRPPLGTEKCDCGRSWRTGVRSFHTGTEHSEDNDAA